MPPGKGGWGELGGIRLQPSASNETSDMFPLSVCLSVSPYQSTLAQIQHIDGLVSLQHHSRTAVSSQLWTARQDKPHL